MNSYMDALARGDIIMDEKDLPDGNTLFDELFSKGDTWHFDKAAAYLMTPVKTIRHWRRTGNFPAMARKLMFIKVRGFLPYTKKWRQCYFDDDENMVTPWGVCRPSDVAFVHRHKWNAEQTREQLNRLKASLDYDEQKQLSDTINQKLGELVELTRKLNPEEVLKQG